MIKVRHYCSTFGTTYYLCTEVVEYGDKRDPWVSLKNHIALDSLPNDEECELIWKYVRRGGGLCTKKENILILKK